MHDQTVLFHFLGVLIRNPKKRQPCSRPTLCLTLDFFEAWFQSIFQSSFPCGVQSPDLLLTASWILLIIRKGFRKIYVKNPAYGRQRISRPMRIVGPIQFPRGCVIYLKKKKKNYGVVDASMRPCVHATAPCVGDGRSAPTPRF